MKKVLFVGMVFGAMALTSCKKDYKCEVGSGDTKIVTEYKDLTQSEADAQEKDCETGIIKGTWSLDL
ncbi:hypothetical protein ERX46_06965 [Brumimicrobium glaciale]|uniref:Lipoprotein n=1 Tax=Brumimicrobium glaciale TaxID=200475 RepID=A0A4Q4KNT1_9FLAO|nr:hypothetical protein [Brumimicrobium glaciale]RYM35111.1 hypothetical protein ERX46_06965 [Brumimicrobium glaciale]